MIDVDREFSMFIVVFLDLGIIANALFCACTIMICFVLHIIASALFSFINIYLIFFQ